VDPTTAGGCGLADAQRLLAAGALVLARILPAVFQAPFLGGRMTPARAKIAVALALTVPLCVPVSRALPAGFTPSGVSVLLLLLKEALIGHALGLTAAVLFHAADAGGRFLDNARGMGAAVLVAPESGAQVSLLGQLYFQMSVALFLLVGGHRWFLQALFDSFLAIPVHAYPRLDAGLSASVLAFIRITASLFVDAIRLVAPGIVAVVITDLCMGIANRVAPTINVFMLSMPLKMMVGILMVALSLALAVRALGGSMARVPIHVRELVLIWAR
jgi:flagellar biosynthesis protein FliR